MHLFLKFILGMKLYMFRTVPLSIIRSCSLYTQQWYMSYSFADSLQAGSGWNILNQDGTSWSCSQTVCKTVWHIPLLCVQWKTPDDGQRNCLKHVEFHSKDKFEKLVHLVGFIIGIYHDAWSHECQIYHDARSHECQIYHDARSHECQIYHDARSHGCQICIYGTSNIAPHFPITSMCYFFLTHLQNGSNFKLHACFLPGCTRWYLPK